MKVNWMFQKNEYACFTFTTDNDEIDIADGNIVEVNSKFVLIDYDNVFGPVTRMQIRRSQIHTVYP